MNQALAQQAPASRTHERPTRFNAYLLNVDFESPAGEDRSAIGGGESVVEAIAAARAELPGDAVWDVARWNDLYGD